MHQKHVATKNQTYFMAKVIGIGGIFFKFNDPQKMKDWYQNALGLKTNDYGVLFAFNGFQASRAYLQLGTFESSSDYFGTDSQKAMINFRVDNLDALKEHLIQLNTTICNEIEEYDYGKFLHILDPEGNRIELWEPEDEAFDSDTYVKMI
jgi:predicted enzyme related to lactoylglutathione lyase